jgi:hypothetical protein
MEQQIEFNFESSIQGYLCIVGGTESVRGFPTGYSCKYFATSFKKKINTLLSSMGTCPTHCSLFPSRLLEINVGTRDTAADEML